MARLRAVVAGFGPFASFDENPSGALARAFESPHLVTGLDVVPLVLPVSHADVAPAVAGALEAHHPDIWLGLGLAAGRSAVSIEQVAVNSSDYPTADVDGRQVSGEPIVPGGPAAIFTSLPATDIVAAWAAEGIPGYLSDSAGRYLCNESFYLAAATVERLGLEACVGFIHVPLLPHQVTHPAMQPSMGFDLLVRAVCLALEYAAHSLRPHTAASAVQEVRP